MSVLGACWKLDKVERTIILGKEGMHEERCSWKEENHACMHGRPNNVRVRVFSIHCNGWQAINV
jgi:uncharacterized UBP type Zn finger protein